MSLDSNSLSNVPKWDRKQDVTTMYIAKLETLVEYHDSRYVLGSMGMNNWPRKPEYGVLYLTNTKDVKTALLYNKK